MKETIGNKDLENKMKICLEEVESLKREIEYLKNDIDMKEEELSRNKLELQESIAQQQSKNEILKENKDLKKRVEILEKENDALKIKIVEEDQITNDNSRLQPAEKANIEMRKIHSCEKCCLHFSTKEKLMKHKDEMHRYKLTF